MKLSFLALLSMGTLALCQSPPQQKVDPDQLFQLPETFTQAAPNFGSLKPLPPMTDHLILPGPSIANPRRMLNNPRIDPEIIVRPPWHGQSEGHEFAHHRFPGLKFLPLRKSPSPR